MAVATGVGDNMADVCGRDQMDGDHGCPASETSEQAVMIDALLLFRTMPDHAGKTLQRHQRLAGIGPLLHLLDGDVIERLPAGTARKERARDVHHMRRTRALVTQRRAASRAKAAHGFARLVLKAGDGGAALGDPEPLAPASDIGGISGAMGAPARRRIIVPGPSRARVDFEADPAAQALACGDATDRNRFWLCRHRRISLPPLIARSEAVGWAKRSVPTIVT